MRTRLKGRDGRVPSRCAELPPLSEGGGSVDLEMVPAGETAILVDWFEAEEWTAAKS